MGMPGLPYGAVPRDRSEKETGTEPWNLILWVVRVESPRMISEVSWLLSGRRS
jgi:hypothetical protein